MLKFKRVVAFLLDVLFVCIISTLISNSPLIDTKQAEIKNYNNAFVEKMNNINTEEISKQDDVLEYTYNEIGQLLYDSLKSQVYQLIIFLSVNILYFVVFTYFNQGRTLGCVFTKLKIVKKDDNKVGIFNLLIRSFFMGSIMIYQFPITAVLLIILPRVLSVRAAFVPLLCLSTINIVFEFILLGFFLLSKKDMTIQDYISNTKILASKR